MISRCILTLAASLLLCAQASAFILTFGSSSTSSNSPATGASGTVAFTFANGAAGEVDITLAVDNTTGDGTPFGAGATDSKLTGFGFDFLSGVSYKVGSFVGGTKLDTLILDAAASPFGTLDFAAADNGDYTGGNANDALAPGDGIDMVMLTVTSSLAAPDLESEYQTFFTTTQQSSAMRFQQVNAGAGSDKLTNPEVTNGGTPPQDIPESSMGALLALGLIGLVVGRRHKTAI